MFRTRSKDKLAFGFFGQPVLPFALKFSIVAPLVLAPDIVIASGAYVLGLPWLILFLAVINLPFVGAAFDAFKMDRATRRNHALEHATIYYLRRKRAQRLSGKAERRGFYVRGGVTEGEIRAAFLQVRTTVKDGARLPYVSRHCGSNIVTALGLGLALLLLVALIALLVRPPLLLRCAMLAAVVLLFAGMRHRIGDAFQRRFFMSVDFADVELRAVRRVRPDAAERGPVHFVETTVRIRADAPR